MTTNVNINLRSQSRPPPSSPESANGYSASSQPHPFDSASPISTRSSEEPHSGPSGKLPIRNVSRSDPERGASRSQSHARGRVGLDRGASQRERPFFPEAPDAPTSRPQQGSHSRGSSEQGRRETGGRRKTRPSSGFFHPHDAPYVQHYPRSEEASTETQDMDPRDREEPFATMQHNEYMPHNPQYGHHPQYPPPQQGYNPYGPMPQQQGYSSALVPSHHPGPYPQHGAYPPNGGYWGGHPMHNPQMGMSQMPPYFYPPYGPAQLPSPPESKSSTSEPSAAEVQLAAQLAALLKEKELAEQMKQRDEQKRKEREEWEIELKRRQAEQALAVEAAIKKFKETQATEAAKLADFEKAKAEVKKAATAETEKKAKEAEDILKKKLEETKKELDTAKAATEVAKKETVAAKGPPDKQKFVKLIDPRTKPERTFKVPWLLAKEWRNLEELLRQAFANEKENGVDVVKLIDHGRYHLIRTDGTTVPPAYWNDVVEPGWEVKVVLWPVEASKVVHVPVASQKLKRVKSSNKGKKRSPLFGEVPPAPPEPPSAGLHMPPQHAMPAGVEIVDDDLSSDRSATNTRRKRNSKPPGFFSVMFGGGSGAKSSKR